MADTNETTQGRPADAVPAVAVRRLAYRDRPPAKHPIVFDPAKHCGGKTNALNGSRPCRRQKGAGTDHKGSGHCDLHFGKTINGRKHAESEARAKEALEAFADLSLSKIGDALAREAAARAFGTAEENAEDFARNVTAFDRAADRAEGSKITVESKIEFLAHLPDAELDAAIAEAERLIEQARSKSAA
jgi:hypothetical protein